MLHPAFNNDCGGVCGATQRNDETSAKLTVVQTLPGQRFSSGKITLQNRDSTH